MPQLSHQAAARCTLDVHDEQWSMIPETIPSKADNTLQSELHILKLIISSLPEKHNKVRPHNSNGITRDCSLRKACLRMPFVRTAVSLTIRHLLQAECKDWGPVQRIRCHCQRLLHLTTVGTRAARSIHVPNPRLIINTHNLPLFRLGQLRAYCRFWCGSKSKASC
jgi:hypothetical protein